MQNQGVPLSGSGHSAEPEPSFTVSADTASVPNAFRRYEIGETAGCGGTWAAVFDMARDGECFCLIDPNDCIGGLPTALARAQDVADMFNNARARSA